MKIRFAVGPHAGSLTAVDMVAFAESLEAAGFDGLWLSDLPVAPVLDPLLGLTLAAGGERWTAMEGGSPVLVDGECVGGIGVAGGDWQTDERIAQAAVEAIGASWK